VVPHFDYMGCDSCMEEALRALTREQSKKLGAAGELPLEVAASLKSPRKQVVGQQDKHFPEVA
jgi:hypothetical protein